MPFTVKNLEDAKRIWKEYEEKYAALSGSFAEQRQPYENAKQGPSTTFKQKLEDPEEQAKFKSAANIIGRQWQKRRESEALKQINPQGYHSDNFLDFIRKESVKKSLNKKKIDALYDAMENDWNNPIFHEKNLPYYALALFDAQKITRQQLSTLLDRFQAINTEKEVYSFNLLNPDGSFNEKTQKLLFPQMAIRLTKDQQENFRLLLQALPKSEQQVTVSITTDSPKRAAARARKGALDTTLYEQFYTHFRYKDPATREMHNLNLSFGAMDAINIAKLGPEHLVSAIAALGPKSVTDIGKAVAQDYRATEINFPDVQKPKNVHGYSVEEEEITDTDLTKHDQAHAAFMSAFSKSVGLGIQRIIDVIRTGSGQDQSAITWAFTDAEFSSFYRNKSINPDLLQDPKYTTEKFIELLSTPYGEDIQKRAYLGLGAGLFHKRALTDLGILVVNDMVSNANEWKKHNIDANFIPDNLTANFKLAAKKIRELQPYLEPMPLRANSLLEENTATPEEKAKSQEIATRNILKFRIYDSLPAKDKPNFAAYAKFIDENPNFIKENEIRFVRNNIVGYLGLVNGKKDLAALAQEGKSPLDMPLIKQKLEEQMAQQQATPKSPRPRA